MQKSSVPMGEKQRIRNLRARVGMPSNHANSFIRLGIGDDCAVLRPRTGEELLVTTDYSIEGVHFRRDWHSAESVGHRCLARGLSDIAAMGGEARAYFLSLALPNDLPQRWVDGFLRGMLRLAGRTGVTLAGGDTAATAGTEVVADIMVIGSVKRERAVLRSGARPGDRIYVTGEMGGAAAVLERLMAGERVLSRGKGNAAHFYPEPRLEQGRKLARLAIATAMIDVSDGLSSDLSHICEESGVGAVVDAAALPLARGASLAQALHGGEDYELLFTAAAAARVPKEVGGVAVRCIGEIVAARKPEMWISTDGKREQLPARGWEHFRK